ncbi:MAG: diphosphate--fructose-6-phosphate 1-phosphotransferase, partial [Eubacteriales bacterium]|nr:diphosphate--fructose-6-phosphate 1-phosphotransferase [Eubacteriales bacterium]
MGKNILVALGGGPSPVINASLAGVIDGCNARFTGSQVYCACHGIEGVLTEQLANLSLEDPAELARLKNTPASGAIGTCRYKLKSDGGEDFERIITVLRAHDIGVFFYIGGNDSMDTADKIAKLAEKRGLPLTVVGVPKTIDNDVGDEAFTLIDHTPGYGSAARFWCDTVAEAEEENRGMCVSERVCVLQAMGRNAGFIAAAARLADVERSIPLQLYFAEVGKSMEELAEHVNSSIKACGRCIVVVNEGFGDDTTSAVRDGFGHVEYGAGSSTATQRVVTYLNLHGLAARGSATGQVPGVLQRSTALHRSPVDVEEAYVVGAHAAALAASGKSGVMATILRAPGNTYQALYKDVPLAAVANSERRLPASWIAPNGLDV